MTDSNSTAVRPAPVRSPNGWTPERLQQVSEDFEGRPPEALLSWAIEHFAPELALGTSFGPQGVVLMHLLSVLQPETTVFYLETDLLFAETYALRDQLSSRLGMAVIPVSGLSVQAQAEKYGPALWSREPDQCCALRKVEPLRRFLSTQRAWITGIRRSQTANRAKSGLVEWDTANGLVKLNPLAGWTTEQVWEYIRAHELPYNELHDQGYPSIGCWPCTRPVAAGEDERAGRWAGLAKTECGIHLQPEGKRDSTNASSSS